MSFVLDQKTVFAEFTAAIPAEVAANVRPHITGPHAELHRYNNPTEKLAISLGTYDPAADHTYTWPGKSTGAVVDQSYVQLWIDNALLNFYNDLIGAGGIVTAPSATRIRTSGSPFKSSTGNARDTQLGDRDVQKGDVVHINAGGNDLWTYVSDIIPDVVAAVVGAATAEAANAATQSASATATQTAGGHNQVTATGAIGSYNGLATGDINETYTVTVTTGSTGGDATTARLRVTSASGRDDVPSVTPATFGAATNIGTRGARITFALDGGAVVDPGVTPSDMVPGQTWQLAAHQAFTAPVATSGGTYTGTAIGKNPKYIVTVGTGGSYASGSPPQIVVTRDDGADSSGPTPVTAAATPVAIGTMGVTIAFSGTALRKGDIYYVPVTGPTNGPYKTLVLGSNISTALQAATDLNLSLFIRKNISVAAVRAGSPPGTNWTTNASGITVKAGLTAYDASVTNGGLAVAVPVKADVSTVMYVHYRAWLNTYVGQVNPVTVPNAINAATVVAAALGPVDPDNPLAYAVYKACQNANGQTVYFTAVGDPSVQANWLSVPPMLEGLTQLYGLVPLSHDPVVHTAWKTHCVARSDDAVGGEWRCCWLPLQAQSSNAVVNQLTSSDGNQPMATLTANTVVTGNPITLITCTTGNAKFVTRGVLPGDVVRYLYSVDTFGKPTYQEFIVDHVVNEDTLVLATAYTGAVTTAQSFEVWRNLTRDQIGQALVATITANVSKRVRYVWPDLLGDSGHTVDGFHLCAALAGFVSGIAPHQSIRNVSLAGFDDVSRSTTFLSNTQLNSLAAAGCVVVTQDSDGVIYTRVARTTDLSSLDNREEMIVRNDDTFKHVLYGRCQGSLGQTNITPTGMAQIRADVQAAINFIKGHTLIDRIGTMVTDASILDLHQHSSDLERIVLTVSSTRPYPANTATITLEI